MYGNTFSILNVSVLLTMVAGSGVGIFRYNSDNLGAVSSPVRYLSQVERSICGQASEDCLKFFFKSLYVRQMSWFRSYVREEFVGASNNLQTCSSSRGWEGDVRIH